MSNRERYVDLSIESEAQAKNRCEAALISQRPSYRIGHPKLTKKVQPPLDFSIAWIGLGMMFCALAMFICGLGEASSWAFVIAVCLLAYATGVH